MKLEAVYIALLSALVSQAAPLAQETHESAVERAKRMVPLVRAINDEFDRALLDLKHETLNMKLLTSLDGRETDNLEKSLAQEFVQDYLGLKAGHEAFLQYGPPQPGLASEPAGSLVRKPREIHAEDILGDEGPDDDLEPKEIVEDEFNAFPPTAEVTQNQAGNDEETVSEEAVEIVAEQVEPIALPSVSETADDDSAVEEAREVDTIITSPSVPETTQVSGETELVVEETSETDSHAESKSKDAIESVEPNVQETTEAPIETLDVSASEEFTSGMNPEENLESNEIDEEDESANPNTAVEDF